LSNTASYTRARRDAAIAPTSTAIPAAIATADAAATAVANWPSRVPTVSITSFTRIRLTEGKAAVTARFSAFSRDRGRTIVAM
jgi:hypothetical protein